MVCREDTTRASLWRKVFQLRTSVTALQALVTQANVLVRSGCWVANCHAETLKEVRILESLVAKVRRTGWKDLTEFAFKLSVVKSC